MSGWWSGTWVGAQDDPAVADAMSTGSLIAIAKALLRQEMLAVGVPADAAVTDPTGSPSVIAALKGLLLQERDARAGNYKAVAASQTNAIVGTSGAVGDFIDRLIIFPASVSPGAVTLTDGTTAIASFPGGTASLSTLAPIVVPVGAHSVNGAWKITTGASVSVLAVGKLT